MHELADFVPYEGQTPVNGEHPVLAWSKRTGYFFTQYGFCVDDLKIIAIKEVY